MAALMFSGGNVVLLGGLKVKVGLSCSFLRSYGHPYIQSCINIDHKLHIEYPTHLFDDLLDLLQGL
ncbi:hypothetical protein EON63_08335 [archaeon]|nr:MAG: hypothetical protein EON63_08335 [archaeon]